MDDDEDDSSGSTCEPLVECSSMPPMTDSLDVQDYEVLTQSVDHCSDLGIDVTVLDAQFTSDRTRLEARVRFSVTGGGPYYIETGDRRFGHCYLEAADQTEAVVIVDERYCSATISISIYDGTDAFECGEYVPPVCGISISSLPWPPDDPCPEPAP